MKFSISFEWKYHMIILKLDLENTYNRSTYIINLDTTTRMIK